MIQEPPESAAVFSVDKKWIKVSSAATNIHPSSAVASGVRGFEMTDMTILFNLSFHGFPPSNTVRIDGLFDG